MVVSEKQPLRPGNSKLGPSIWQFSLAAIETCPGRSKECEKLCYACKHHYLRGNVKDRMAYNDAIRKRPEFVRRVNATLWLNGIQTVRIHPSGDFDSVEYIQKWHDIAAANPRVTFFAYTRSWRVPELLPSLTLFSRLSNVHLWWSCDKGTGAPVRRAGVRRAYMAVDDTDEPKFRVDLVFRVKTRTRKLQVADTLVCPAERQRQPVRRDEQGRKIEAKKVTCAVCRLCFARQDWLDKANQRLRGQPEQLVSIGKPCVSSST